MTAKMNNNITSFGNKRGKRCEGNCCKVSQTKNGQFSITLPKNIVEDKGIKKGDKLRFIDEGVWIKLEFNHNP